jgi:hypothetical protein
MDGKKKFQLHHKYVDGKLEYCSQIEIDPRDEPLRMKEWIDRTKDQFPLPMGGFWVIMAEGAEGWVEVQ